MKVLNVYFIIATLFSLLANASPIEKRASYVGTAVVTVPAGIASATTVSALSTCSNLSTDLPTGFSATTRTITPQWVVDNDYTGSLLLFTLAGYSSDEEITLYEYSGYLYAPQEGIYILDTTFVSSTLDSHSKIYYGDDAGMDCCGDISDSTVDWYKLSL
ncbi:unnamed protein product [[Candida] boidinii]|uniref:Unnamed protein product n=1 Tax=Candida boidinii TaxID=5477 RepID=A0ACB5TVP4_CANBO|nr:unnamed protein product [[Candida] boidinii]